jgi:hypothetical protein
MWKGQSWEVNELARALIEHAINTEPWNPSNYEARGFMWLAYGWGDRQSVFVDYVTALALDSASAEGAGKITALPFLPRHAKLALLEKVLRERPNDEEALSFLEHQWRNAGEWGQDKEYLERFLRILPPGHHLVEEVTARLNGAT